MTSFSLYDRSKDEGTITEPEGIPDPIYTLPSTTNWMRALAMIVKDEEVNFQEATDFFSHTSRMPTTPKQENSIFEHLLLAVHQLSALRAMQSIPVQSDVARVASVAWYYGIFYAAGTAMVAAQDGSLQDNHTQTAKSWDNQFALRNKVLHFFDLRVSTLVKKNAEVEIDKLRRGPKANLVNEPLNIDEAHRCLCGYLSGTRDWWAGRLEEEIKASKDFQIQGFSNFRKKAAQQIRDKRLGKHSLSFLHQAIRFRGKANYREALYLAHGVSVESTISDFIEDMADVLEAFLAMAGAFAFQKIGSELSSDFLEDLDKFRSFSLDPRSVWT